MRKNLLLPLALAVALSLVACGGAATSDPSASGGTGAAEGTAAPTEAKVVLQLDQAIAETDKGQLRGYIDNGIYTYKGVPYATAGRYEEPVEVEAWEGVRDAQVYGDMCPQADMTAGAAEALNTHNFWPMATDETKIQTLNVWTGSLDPGSKKAVLFWIHGGGFSSGASTEQVAYDGRNLAEYGDVVVVSINHRLNCLGYLDLSEYGDAYKHSGNLGQMDIVAALEWVQRNISNFGGDPDNVTIFGQSGGGRKVLNLMGTPSADGLFDKAIGQSCGQQSVTQETARSIAARTVANLGLTAETIDQIKDVPYDDLRAAADAAIAAYNEETGESYAFSPVVDGDFMPKDIWLEGALGDEGKDVPLMIGSTFAERTTNAFSYVTGSPTDKGAMTDEEVEAALAEKYGDQKDAVVEAFKKAYPDMPVVDALYVDVTSYRVPILDVANSKAAQGGAPVYTYVFSYEFPTMGGWLPWHCSEIPFVFHNIERQGLTFGLTESEYRMQDTMASAWVNFAKTGTPSADGLVEWPAYTVDDGATMVFGEESFVGNHHDADLIKAITEASE